MQRALTLPMAIVLTLTLLIVVGSPGPAGASQSPEEFFKGKRVTIMVPHAPGGGTDLVARLITTFWPKYTGGTMEVENISAGGTIVGNNNVARSKPDGLRMACSTGGEYVRGALFKEVGVEYDPRQMNYIIAIAPSLPHVLGVGKDSPYNSLDDLAAARKLGFGVTSPAATQAIVSAALAEVRGLKQAKIITGFKGTPEIALAVAKGELECMANTAEIIAENARKGLLKPLLAFGTERPIFFPKIPTIYEAMKLTPQQKELIDLADMFGSFSAEKALWVPPRVPQDRVQFLRDVFNKMVADKTFDERLKQIRPEWQQFLPQPIKGEDYSKSIQDLWTQEKHALELSALVKKYQMLR